MKANVYSKYGTPDVLELRELQKPTVKDDEVLIRVHGASVNPYDWHHLRGKPFMVRPSAGLFKPKNRILGADLAGRIVAVGKNTSQFKPGDEVFGEGNFGSFAEYVSLREERLSLKPAGLTFEEAAAIPMVALSALQGLRDTGNIQPGQKVLINGASGGIGTFAIQIAKYYGANVTGVCSGRNQKLVHSLGADQVIDYTREDFSRNGQVYDLIVDAVGNCTVADYKRALRPGGITAVLGFTKPLRMLQVFLLGAWESRFGNKKIKIMMTRTNRKDLEFIKELIESEQIKPVIDRRYPLSQVAEALRYLGKGHAQGKVVITV